MNVPKLRFKEFDGEWEADFLEKAIDVKSGKDYKHLDKGNVPVYGTGGYMLSVNDYLSDKDAIGIGRKGSIDKPQKLIAPFWTVDTLFYCLPKEHNNLSFLFTLFQKVPWKKFDESTGVPSLSKTTIEKIKINLPNKDEQKKIGDFFELINKKIQLQQQKIDLLQEQKKGFLQKMFPKVGAVMPEIRFTGFTDDWGQRNIKEISKVFIGLVTSMTENYRDEGTLLIRNSDIKPGRLEFADNPIHLDEKFAEKNATRRLQIGDVVTVHTGDIGTSAVIGERENGAIGFATINTRPDTSVLDSAYLNNYFNTTYHKNWAIKMSTGDGRSNYNLYDFNRLMIPLPRLEEQKKIGAFINKLDDTIALHQQKLDFYKKQKKGFMQQMFI